MMTRASTNKAINATKPSKSNRPNESSDTQHLKELYGVNAYKLWVSQKNKRIRKKRSKKIKTFEMNLLNLSPKDLNYRLTLFIKEIRKPNGKEYSSGSIYYLCLGIQKYIHQNGRREDIFTDPDFKTFNSTLHYILKAKESAIPPINFSPRIRECVLWEAKQLGMHSPYTLLNSLMYFLTKHFQLTNVEDHFNLTFSQVRVTVKYIPGKSELQTFIQWYPTIGCEFYCELQQNDTDFMKCPVKFLEFYMLQVPDNCIQEKEAFYYEPNPSSSPSNWFIDKPLSRGKISEMLQRIKLIEEI